MSLLMGKLLNDDGKASSSVPSYSDGTCPDEKFWVIAPGENPAKVAGLGDKDLFQDIDLARIFFGEVSPLHQDAR